MSIRHKTILWSIIPTVVQAASLDDNRFLRDIYVHSTEIASCRIKGETKRSLASMNVRENHFDALCQNKKLSDILACKDPCASVWFLCTNKSWSTNERDFENVTKQIAAVICQGKDSADYFTLTSWTTLMLFSKKVDLVRLSLAMESIKKTTGVHDFQDWILDIKTAKQIVAEVFPFYAKQKSYS